MTRRTYEVAALIPSPAPWSFEYSPYTLQDGNELGAFEIFDAEGDKVFDTNEDTPIERQEANALLAAAAPELKHALGECLRLLADYEEADGDEGDVYRQGIAALSLCQYNTQPKGEQP